MILALATLYTAKQAVQDFAANAKRIISLGTCAAYGGIPAGAPNPTSSSGVSAILPNADAKKIVNIPGCPAPGTYGDCATRKWN